MIRGEKTGIKGQAAVIHTNRKCTLQKLSPKTNLLDIIAVKLLGIPDKKDVFIVVCKESNRTKTQKYIHLCIKASLFHHPLFIVCHLKIPSVFTCALTWQCNVYVLHDSFNQAIYPICRY